MKKITITDPQEIIYISNLIKNDVKILETNLQARQKILKKYEVLPTEQ